MGGSLAVAEFNAVLNHLPMATATAPATLTAGCASIVPLAHAVNPGNNTMLPTVKRRVDTVDITFGCLVIR